MKNLHSVKARLIFSLALGLALLVIAYPTMHAAAQQGAQTEAQMPAVGTAAPDFTLSSQEGTTVSLHDFKGKWVILYFYPKDMTQGCTIEAHNFQRDLDQYTQKNAVILGVSVDSVDSHKEFCTKESLTFKLLADTSHDVVNKYGSLHTYGTGDKAMVAALRNTFLINPQGMIVKVYTKVNPTPHSADILTDLTAMQATK